MSTSTRAVFDAFPESRDRVEALIADSVEFAELCENYDDVVAAHCLAADTRKESPLGPAAEYHLLRLELEAEILESLERS